MCKNHIMRNHNSSKLWLRPMLDEESSGAKSMDELVAFYSLSRDVDPRKPFDRFDIFDGFQCSECGETSRSRTVILRHVKKCQNGCIRSVKCQQPLSWADPRNPTHNFQRIFPVKEEERELRSFPESCFQESQKLETEGTLVDPMSLGMLLNWTTLHRKCFMDIPDSVFKIISEAEGREEWLPKVKVLAATYFQKIHQTILEVESQGCQRDLCRIRMHSKHGIVPARGFYWLGSDTIVKYTSILSRLMSLERIISHRPSGARGRRAKSRYEFEVLYRNIPRSTDPGDENPSFQPWANVKHLSALKEYCRQPTVAAELGAGFYVSENEEDE